MEKYVSMCLSHQDATIDMRRDLRMSKVDIHLDLRLYAKKYFGENDHFLFGDP